MFKRVFSLGLVFIFLISINPAFSEDASLLGSLIRQAQENNPDILAAKKEWEASLARIHLAKSLDSPTLGVSFMKIKKGGLRLDQTMPEDRVLSVSQMFPFFGKLPLKEKIALVESQMLASEYKYKELEVRNAVIRAYYDLFMNYKEIELKQESAKLLTSIAEVAEKKYSLGNISQEEVIKLYLEIASVNNDVINLKHKQTAQITRLNILLNRDPESTFEAVPVLEEDNYSRQELPFLYKQVLLNNPEILIFSYAIEKNKYAESLAKKNYLPDMMAQIGLRGITSGTGIGLWDLMLAFSMPFWFWTKQRYQVKEAVANLGQAKAAYEAMKNRAFQEIKGLAVNMDIAAEKASLYKDNLLPLLEGSIQSSLSGFKAGKNDFMMLLDSRRMLIQAKMDYYNSLVEYNINLADLELAVGLNLKEVTK